MTHSTFARGRAIAGAALATSVLALATLVPAAQAAEDDTVVQILGINDFHGRILPDAFGGSAGGAALVTAVDDLTEEHPNTVFAAAGDLIGASTFESFIAQDKPTIDVFNNAGLDVSAVGNHEFDQGYDDLVNRVMAPYDATTNPYGGAQWEYLGANVRFVDTGDPALPETWIQTFGDIEVGFVGAVTDETHTLVSPDGITGLEFELEYVAANRSADVLKDAGADLVVLLVHEGAPTTAIEDATDTSNDFGEMIVNLSDDIDAVISGHTHLAYDHRIPVQGWIDEGRTVTERPVVSAGQYGMFLNQLLFTVDVDGNVVGLETDIIDLDAVENGEPVYPADPDTAALIAAAVAEAEVLGAEVLGEIDGPLYRARTATGTPGATRGAESTLGNAVADIQLWATEGNGAQIAFMNPGGLRTDMLGVAGGFGGTYPSDVTYKQAAEVQPFANTLVTMTLTGAQLASVLEEQWQPAGSSRPFLRLGTSQGFAYTYDPATQTIVSMFLDGEPIAASDEVTVVVNSFLAAGGDNFGTFAQGTNRADTGRVDLQAQVDYLAANGILNVPYEQRAVGVTGLGTGPFTAGATVTFGLTSLMMTGPGDVTDSTVTVSLDGTNLGTFPVTNALPSDLYDEHGTASVSVTLPSGISGAKELVVTGSATGTVATIPITVEKPVVVPTCEVTYKVHGTWPKGFISQVWITNTGTTAVKGWDLAWKFKGGEKITDLWNGKFKQKGSKVTVKSLPWNSVVRPGQTVTFGFVGKVGKTPKPIKEFTLNGDRCTVG